MKRTIATKTITYGIEYLEFFYQPQHKMVTAYLIRGYEDADGDFHEVERNAVSIAGATYDELIAANASGKVQGKFRNDDVLAIVDRLKSS